jgi:pyrimidine deaminase RibD-like protein
MRFIEFTEKDYKIHDRKHLDEYLVQLCNKIIEGQKTDPEKYGMVAACVLGPDHQTVLSVNEAAEDGTRKHAERVAIESYQKIHGKIPEGSIILTTCSPCNEDDTEMAAGRFGESCTDLINHSNVRKVYCGYTDPSQQNQHNKYNLEVTNNPDIEKLCKKFADTFL